MKAALAIILVTYFAFQAQEAEAVPVSYLNQLSGMSLQNVDADTVKAIYNLLKERLGDKFDNFLNRGDGKRH